MSRAAEWLDLDPAELHAVLARIEPHLEEPEHRTLRLGVEGFLEMRRLLADQRLSITRLRQMLFGAPTESSRNLLPEQPERQPPPPARPDTEDNPPPKGHGRRRAEEYTGAEHLVLDHPTLHTGEPCPHCLAGKIYTQPEPARRVNVFGQAPLGATCYALQRLRCNLCGECFTAPAPEPVATTKHDPSAATMIAVLKHGSGFPFNRLAALQEHLGIPVPVSTQWDIVHRAASGLLPVHHELIRQAAQGELLHNDDTTMRVLELRDPEARRQAFADLAPERCATFTSGIVSVLPEHSIALFFTGPRHAGENLAEVLNQRARELCAPIQMCDALSRNVSSQFESIVANCIAHARRKFVEIFNSFPDECTRVLETLRDVYKNDATARKDGLSPEQRLVFHQTHSASLMNALHAWMNEQIDNRLVEPNSGLGQAIAYLSNHWEKLTRFLHLPGVPLDNNLCERALKKAILHRKASLFFKTLNGARVGDLFMSLIYTCQLVGADPFDYLTVLQKHPGELERAPQQWMPWNYGDALARASPG